MKIRETVPALPKGMKTQRGCSLCGQRGEVVFVKTATRWEWRCKGGCRDAGH